MKCFLVLKTLDCISSTANKACHWATKNDEQQDIYQHGMPGPLGSERALKALHWVQTHGSREHPQSGIPAPKSEERPLDPCGVLLAVPVSKLRQ